MLKALIAVDGSESAGHVLDALAPWLRAAGAQVELLTVMDSHELHETLSPASPRHELTPAGSWSGTALGIPEPRPVTAETRSQAIERVQNQLLARLRTLAKAHLPGVQCDVHVCSNTHTAQAIVGRAVAVQANAIGMGTHGRTGLRRAMLGSVAEGVVRTSPVPVFLVRQGSRGAQLEPPPPGAEC